MNANVIVLAFVVIHYVVVCRAETDSIALRGCANIGCKAIVIRTLEVDIPLIVFRAYIFGHGVVVGDIDSYPPSSSPLASIIRDDVAI